ncbi:hypothetical protein, partial [Streptomyces collinus]|uniref:hypothetical protein n=1 Tax=Streptomyces collinus TaxID=42684 RepID=UPI00363DFBBA
MARSFPEISPRGLKSLGIVLPSLAEIRIALDLADVVGVGVDFPLAAARGDGGGLAAVRAQQV